ncbi:MAG: aldo/keto reductase [Candidatus Sumerlaeia bacterium]|nr:aldo/keto reductase [Candidatus Sumerlaeia bacterium]
MERRPFGNTGLECSPLGFGAGHIGSPDMSEEAASRLLHTALDLGVSLIDTARGYGLSEERIGRHLAGRRDEFLLASKCGYGIDGHADWTPGCVAAGIDEALRRLRTDRIDVMLFHSCPGDTLHRDGLVEALEAAVRAGKVRAAGYSGENESLDEALRLGRFRAIETSVNVFDQRGLARGVRRAAAAGLGVIAKRPLANAPWRFSDCPHGNYCEPYWHRMRAMGLNPGDMPWDELALRFSAYAPGVSCAIVGTSSEANLRRNAAIAEKGPLAPEDAQAVRDAFLACHHWDGQV